MRQKSANHVQKENTIRLSMALVLNVQIKLILSPVFLVVMMNAPYLNPSMMGTVVSLAHKYSTLRQENVNNAKKDFISIKIKEFVLKKIATFIQLSTVQKDIFLTDKMDNVLNNQSVLVPQTTFTILKQRNVNVQRACLLILEWNVWVAKILIFGINL